MYKAPKIIYGTSSLGNLYVSLPLETKLEIVKTCINSSNEIAFFDSAGKYGAGLSLEVLGQCLSELHIPKDRVIISNKLGWYRVPLSSSEPTFELGVWKDIKYDAVQKISYDGILQCYEQGNQLLNGYFPQFVSVHDPDEYINSGKSSLEQDLLYQDILDAYKALLELKQQGKVSGVGVGSKDWKFIERLEKDVSLDWVMIANSFTIHSHPVELSQFMLSLKEKNIMIVNSAVFNGGFLIGSDYYNYVYVDSKTIKGQELIHWRNQFFEICQLYHIQPSEACFYFAMYAVSAGASSIALNTSRPERIQINLDMVNKQVPQEFWECMAEKGLINKIFLENLLNKDKKS